MSRKKKVTGIILSGGKSSRMGTEKGLVKYKEKPLIEYSTEALQPICDQLVISSNKDCYNYLNLPVIDDEIKECGPIGGIYSSMKAFPSDIYLVVSCDIPNITTDLFSDMLVQLLNNDSVIPIDLNGKNQPLAACYTKNCFPIFESELKNGRLKMMKLLAKLNVQYFNIKDYLNRYPANIFFNTNSPEDLK